MKMDIIHYLTETFEAHVQEKEGDVEDIKKVEPWLYSEQQKMLKTSDELA